ncbi:dTDP-4-dehydrorhamnose reductase [Collimonas pratensis]|uniref:dTDP-4-dehydrorhamnose reductase n=1 Tax=Collimonas pratensis TaxID=279113 RepID=UPI0007834F14|nr:dTDP-4-dehydrorhamnose reductase [Collimonas pratensis]
MKILLTGKTGQVGYELERSLRGLGEVVALSRAQMDLTSIDQIRDVIRAIKPKLIVNAAAYTAVDRAETESELAMLVNGEAPAVMAHEAKKLGAAMIHFSTDYVFDGEKKSPYTESDPVGPINVYGHTKCAGEQAIQAEGISHLVLRTSWVYGTRGNNFLLTVLRLAQERDELRIVSDQFGAPTWCKTIADATAHIVAQSIAAPSSAEWWREHSGVYHLTAKGQATWYEFARMILEYWSVTKKTKLISITTQEYPVTARRPMYSVMSCKRFGDFMYELPDWDRALQACSENVGL